jgi:hypothetical protein
MYKYLDDQGAFAMVWLRVRAREICCYPTPCKPLSPACNVCLYSSLHHHPNTNQNCAFYSCAAAPTYHRLNATSWCC